MKYIRFQANGEKMYGVLEGETITKLDRSYLEKDAVKVKKNYLLSEVDVLSPVEPTQIIAIGLNYEKHALEVNKPIPDEPMMFMVSPSSIIGEKDEIKLPNLKRRIDFEAELAIVIGKKAYKVKEEDALSYVLGFTINNDVSDRDFQKKDGQFTRAKSFETFKPFGPVIETEIDPNNVQIRLSVNGEVKQDSNTSDFIHDVESVIEHITETMTLYPGDVIITGTPPGVAPLKIEDKVEIEIEGIGKLTNYVVYESN